jgi:hypothetical protein
MSCGLSRQELIAFNIPREGQICKAEYDDENGIRHVCNCLISKHRSEAVSFQQGIQMLFSSLIIFMLCFF